jgi:RHS repeat-associated protein
VGENSSFARVSSINDANASLSLLSIKAPKNGYAYVYVSNESDEPVYFDNLKVALNRGRLIEENHYYAYGLRIAGLSSRKLGSSLEGSLKNNYLYNDKELFDDGDLNWYDYGFRNYDAQIGRFTQLDPLTDDYTILTPYQYGSCDPITNIDVDGLEGASAVGGIIEGAKNSFQGELVIISKKTVTQFTKETVKVGGLSLVTHLVIQTAKVVVTQQVGRNNGHLQFSNNAKQGVASKDHTAVVNNNPNHLPMSEKNNWDRVEDWLDKMDNKIRGDLSDKVQADGYVNQGVGAGDLKGNPTAGPRSRAIDWGSDLESMNFLRESLSVMDFIRPAKLKQGFEVADKATEVYGKTKEMIKEKKEKKEVKSKVDLSKLDSIWVDSPFMSYGHQVGWRVVGIKNPNKH